jgi:hypothetical protein
MLGEYIGQFLPLSGGSNFPMTGSLYLNGNGINYDPVASAGSDGSGNFSASATTSQFYQTTTDANDARRRGVPSRDWLDAVGIA